KIVFTLGAVSASRCLRQIQLDVQHFAFNISDEQNFSVTAPNLAIPANPQYLPNSIRPSFLGLVNPQLALKPLASSSLSAQLNRGLAFASPSEPKCGCLDTQATRPACTVPYSVSMYRPNIIPA
ncbi:hypothetical protein CCMA1212_005691, partial [Trichoderma ghanense]